MKSVKKMISVLLASVLLFSVFTQTASAAVENISKHTIMQYKSQNLTFEKPEDEQYKCAILYNNNKYIDVSYGNEGEYYWLYVRAKKPTTNRVKPIIMVYKEQDGKKIIFKRFEITVSAYQKVSMSDVKLNKGTGVNLHLKNPYDHDYKLSFDKSIISIKQVYFSGDDQYYILKGLKNGKTTVKAYFSGTQDIAGSFTVNVGDYAASIKSSYKKVDLKFNSHISALMLEGASLDIGEAINYYHTDATYSVTVSDKNVLATKSSTKTETTPASVLVYAKKTGKATVTLYEKRKNKSKKKVGTISIEVKRVNDSEVFRTNMEYDNDPIFYEFYIWPGGRFDLKNTVINRYINCSITGSKFKDNEYSFEFYATPPEELTIDANGILSCIGYVQNAPNEVGYTVNFADGSSVSQSGSINVCDPNEEYDY